MLLILLGPYLPESVYINELTTVAGAYCAAQFIGNGNIQGSAAGLRIAAGMNGNLVNIANGSVSASAELVAERVRNQLAAVALFPRLCTGVLRALRP